MPTFEYKGYDQEGRVARGLIGALDLKDARERLAHQGILAESVQAAGRTRSWVWRRKDVLFTLDTRAAFYRELASILQAGIPLSGALSLLMEAPEMGSNRSLIAGIRDRISEGDPLADAVASASPRVTDFERALIETGERSGKLDEVIDRVAGFLEEERTLRDRLGSALIYPCVILLLSVAVGLAMWWFMLPAFRELLLESGLEMPWITRVLMHSGQIAGYVIPMVMALVIVASWRATQHWRREPDFRIRLDARLHRLPVVRSFYSVLVHVRFTRTLALLLRSGVPLLEALTQAAAASGSPWVVHLMEREGDTVRQGAPLSDALSRIPPLASGLPGWVRAGEASGDLAGMLEHAAARSQQVWERRITRTTTLIESALVVFVGACVFVLALAIILPILSLNQGLQ